MTWYHYAGSNQRLMMSLCRVQSRTWYNAVRSCGLMISLCWVQSRALWYKCTGRNELYYCARRNRGNNITVLGAIENLWCHCAGRNRRLMISVCWEQSRTWCHCARRNQGYDVIVLGAIKDMISLCWAQSRIWCHCAGRNRGHYDHFAHKMVFQYVYVKYSMDVWLVKTILYWLLKNEKRYEIKTYWRYFLLLPVTRALRAVCMIS